MSWLWTTLSQLPSSAIVRQWWGWLTLVVVSWAVVLVSQHQLECSCIPVVQDKDPGCLALLWFRIFFTVWTTFPARPFAWGYRGQVCDSIHFPELAWYAKGIIASSCFAVDALSRWCILPSACSKITFHRVFLHTGHTGYIMVNSFASLLGTGG